MSAAPRVVGWKIWYSDDQIWTDKSGLFSAAPASGVVEMAVYYRGMNSGKPDQIHRYFFGGHDWYFSDGADAFGSNSDTEEANGAKYPGWHFKSGVWVSAARMQEITDLALADYTGLDP